MCNNKNTPKTCNEELNRKKYACLFRLLPGAVYVKMQKLKNNKNNILFYLYVYQTIFRRYILELFLSFGEI